jgi:obg-like ATPase 1
MPPKKAAAPEKKTLLGRPSNNLKIGIVGLPNVGKSSFFNVLSNTGPYSSLCHPDRSPL